MTTEPGKPPTRLIDSALRDVLDDVVIRSDLNGYPGRNIREHIAALEAELAEAKDVVSGLNRFCPDIDSIDTLKAILKERNSLRSALSTSQARAEKYRLALEDFAELDQDFGDGQHIGPCDSYGVCIACSARSCILQARQALAESDEMGEK